MTIQSTMKGKNTMKIKFDLTGTTRKELVKAISEITGAKAKYLFTPTYAYEIDYFTVTLDGALEFDDRADSEEIETLPEKLEQKGFHADVAAAKVESAGYDPYEKKILGITAMQKMLGKTKFDELLGGLVEKPQGKPTLVKRSDKRPELRNTAQNDFKEFQGGQEYVKV